MEATQSYFHSLWSTQCIIAMLICMTFISVCSPFFPLFPSRPISKHCWIVHFASNRCVINSSIWSPRRKQVFSHSSIFRIFVVAVVAFVSLHFEKEKREKKWKLMFAISMLISFRKRCSLPFTYKEFVFLCIFVVNSKATNQTVMTSNTFHYGREKNKALHKFEWWMIHIKTFLVIEMARNWNCK